jgi:hypothetical protein
MPYRLHVPAQLKPRADKGIAGRHQTGRLTRLSEPLFSKVRAAPRLTSDRNLKDPVAGQSPAVSWPEVATWERMTAIVVRCKEPTSMEGDRKCAN